MTNETERTPETYRRDLYRARLVIGQLGDEAMASGESLPAADLALDALWDGLDRIDSHFWEVEEIERIRRGASKEQRPQPMGKA